MDRAIGATLREEEHRCSSVDAFSVRVDATEILTPINDTTVVIPKIQLRSQSPYLLRRINGRGLRIIEQSYHPLRVVSSTDAMVPPRLHRDFLAGDGGRSLRS